MGKEDIEHGLREVFGADSHKLHVHTEDAAEHEEGMGDSHSKHALHFCNHVMGSISFVPAHHFRFSCLLHPADRNICPCRRTWFSLHPRRFWSLCRVGLLMGLRIDVKGDWHAGLDLQLLETAQRQAHLTKGMPSETRRRRMVGWLQRRGHSWDTISSLLREMAL